MSAKVLIAATIILLTSPGLAFADQQRVVPLFEGMTITTSNSYGNVEVRAMSFGPGFCATHITVHGRTVVIAAPPGVYSDWVIVNSHGGSVSWEVSKEDICDVGTQAQVRYFAP